MSAMYGYCDRANPSVVLWRADYSLGDVWRALRGVGNVAIVRLADDRIIARRGLNGPWELAR